MEGEERDGMDVRLQTRQTKEQLALFLLRTSEGEPDPEEKKRWNTQSYYKGSDNLI